MRKRILYYAIKYDGDYQKIAHALINKEPYQVVDYPGFYICLGDNSYPKNLQCLKHKPFILFYEGDIRLLEYEMLAVVGSREMTLVGKQYCQLLMNEISPHYVTISGLARGVDAMIHHLSLYNRKTIAVLGNGLDVEYPKENAAIYTEMRKRHLLISEYPQGVKPYAAHFPWRNRLIAALGKKLVVIEAKRRSGTMITVNAALEIDREVFCFPHSFLSEQGQGCNSLIRDGASVLVDRQDVKEL